MNDIDLKISQLHRNFTMVMNKRNFENLYFCVVFQILMSVSTAVYVVTKVNVLMKETPTDVNVRKTKNLTLRMEYASVSHKLILKIWKANH